jgi:hypothetical protein
VSVCVGEHVPAATNTHAIIEELLDASFSIRSVSYQRGVCGSLYPIAEAVVLRLPKSSVKKVMSLGTKNHCAYEDQQKYTGLDRTVYHSSLLGNGSINTFPWQRGIVGRILCGHCRVNCLKPLPSNV